MGSIRRIYVGLLLGYLLLLSCESVTPIGSNVIDQPFALKNDTLVIDDVVIDALDYYSGGYNHFPVGKVSDPIFGQITAVAYIRPFLDTVVIKSLSDDEVNGELQLVFNHEQLYGYVNSMMTFNIYKLTEPWREKEQTYQNEVQYNIDTLVGTVDVVVTDFDTLITVNIPLEQQWIDSYINYGDISIEDNILEYYVEHFYGLAIVPQNTGLLFHAIVENSFFRFQNEVDTTYSNVRFRDYAVYLDRDTAGVIDIEDTYMIHTTQEQFISLNVDNVISDNILLSLAELRFSYYDLSLNVAYTPSGFVRPSVSDLVVVSVANTMLPDYFLYSNIGRANLYTEIDTLPSIAYIDITAYINSLVYSSNIDNKLYAVNYYGNISQFFTSTNSLIADGIIRSALIYSSTTPMVDKRPKLVITKFER